MYHVSRPHLRGGGGWVRWNRVIMWRRRIKINIMMIMSFDGDDSDVYPSSWALPVTAIIKSPSVATIFDGSWITWLVKIALGVFDYIHQCKTVQDSLVILSMIWLGDIWLPSWYTHLMQGHFCTRLYLYLYPVLRPRVLDRVHIGVHITEVWIIPSWVMRIRFLLKV